jgi:penicillin-binding protein 2
MNWRVSTPQDEVKEYSDRYKYIYILVAVTLSIFIIRLWYLQIFKGTEFRYYSEQNLVKFQKMMAPRGRILDRNGVVLVDNYPGFEAIITPQYVEDLDATAAAISKILNIPEKHIIRLVQKGAKEEGRYRAVRIKENLTRDEVARLERIRLDYPGLDVNMFIKRSYPYHEVGAQLLGYVAEISKTQLPVLNRTREETKKFRQGDIIGKTGIEQTYDDGLRGIDGLSFVQVDARGRIANIKDNSLLAALPSKQEPTPGNNLMLTIDGDLQNAAYKSFQEKQFIGGLVALDPRNGEILAWVNAPSYDPNTFSTGISQKLWAELTNDPFKPLRNKVIQDHYAPGSTFKTFVALAGIQEKTINTSSTEYCPGHLRFGRKLYHCHAKGGHGYVNIYQALEMSCNIFFYKLGIKLGIDNIAKYASALGMGKKTGVEVKNEVSGLMPTEKWKEDQLGEPWQPGENLSNAIGQGFVLTTPLQLAIAYGSIGNEGPFYKPHIIKKILDADEQVVKEMVPELVGDPSKAGADGKPLISKETFRIIKDSLFRVTNGERGTAKWYKIPGVKFAGKTGTVQNYGLSADQVYVKCEGRPIRQRHHGWFVAYAPAENPQIAVAILAEHACHGSSAAPVVRDVMLAYFQKYHPEMLEQKDKPHDPKVAPPPSLD